MKFVDKPSYLNKETLVVYCRCLKHVTIIGTTQEIVTLESTSLQGNKKFGPHETNTDTIIVVKDVMSFFKLLNKR